MTDEKLYKTSEVAKIMRTDRKTIYKWLPGLPPDGWFKTVKGHLRFKEWLVDKLKNGKI